MTSLGQAAKGALLIWNNFPVAELTNISGPSSSSDEVDITNHDSQGDYKEFVMGMADGGEFSIEGNFVPVDTNGQTAMIADHYSRTLRTAAVCFLGSGFQFSATMKSFKVGAPVLGVLSFSATLKVSGKPTYYSTAATQAAGLTTPFFALRDNGSNSVATTETKANTTYNYTATLDFADTHVAVQPTASAGTIYVNGAVTVSGAWTSNIVVAVGTTKLIVIEARETSKASKIYRVYVTRPAA